MKLNKLFTLILFSVLLAGCTTENMPESKIETGEAVLRFELGGSAAKVPNTRAGGNNDQTSGLAAAEKEKTVNNVIALLFQEDDGKLFMKKDFIPTEGDPGEPFVINVSTGVYNLYLVANANYELKNSIMNLDEKATLETVGGLLAEQEPDVENEFLMTSKSVYRFEATPGNTVSAGEIPLCRLSVRIDLVNAMNEANITGIIFNNRAVKSNLITGNTMPADASGNKTYNLSENPVNGSVSEPASLEGTIYTYENYSDQTGSRPTLTITYETKEGPKTHDIVFSDSKSDIDAPLALKRNYLYRITLINDMSVKYNLEVLDWDVAETFTAEQLETKLQPQTFTEDPAQAWFEVDPNNVKIDIDGSENLTETMNWYIATGNYHATLNPTTLTACPDGWRLPGQRELMMMWVYNDSKLLPHASKGVFMYAGPERMWARDSYVETARAWATTGETGHTGAYSKEADDSKFVVRCIRDIAAGEHRYPYLGATRTIVSRDADGGIEESALLTGEQIDYLKTTDITTSIYLANDPYNHVSPKFQVAANTVNKIWNEAYTACRDYSETGIEAGEWRLPTQRELMLMHIMSKQKDSGFTMNAYYWCGCTESLAAWLVDRDGYVTSRNKTNFVSLVRCVHDITD